MRDELTALYLVLNTFATRTGCDPEAIGPLLARVCQGLDATLDAHMQRIEQLEARVGELSDELSEACDRLNDLGGKEHRTRW